MSQDMVYEDIPQVIKRVGDNVIAGANNATIILGRDRIRSVDSGYGSVDSENKGKDAGAVHAIAGRRSEDPSIADDRATLYLSAMSDVDSAAGTTGVGPGPDVKKKSAAVMRADCVRIVPRTDIKISVGRAYLTMRSDGQIELDGEIKLTKTAQNSIIKGEVFQAIFNGHIHLLTGTSPGSPTSVPTVQMTAAAMNSRVRV